MDLTQEYSGPYRWDEAKERIPNDYRQMDDTRNEYGPAMTKEEEREYLDLLLTAEEQITF